MKNILPLLLAGAMSVTMLSCSDDKKDDPTPNKTSLLTAKKWRVSAQSTTATLNGNTTTVDEFATMQPCEKDDFTQFKTDKTVVFDQGATKCDPADNQTENGTWDFNSDQTKLNLSDPDFGGIAIPFDIVTLNATTLTLRFTSNASGASSSSTITFTAF